MLQYNERKDALEKKKVIEESVLRLSTHLKKCKVKSSLEIEQEEIEKYHKERHSRRNLNSNPSWLKSSGILPEADALEVKKTSLLEPVLPYRNKEQDVARFLSMEKNTHNNQSFVSEQPRDEPQIDRRDHNLVKISQGQEDQTRS